MVLSIKEAKRAEITRMARKLSGAYAESPPGAARIPQEKERSPGPDEAAADARRALAEERHHAGVAANRGRELMAVSYQKLTRIVLLAAMLYFSALSALYVIGKNLTDAVVLGGMSAVSAAALLAVYLELGRHTLSYRKLELRVLAVYAICHLGLIAHHSLHLDPPRLLDFVLLALVFATTSVSLRGVVVAMAMSSATVLMFTWNTGLATEFGFVLLSAAVIATCLACLVRMTIRREIDASLLAESLRDSAEIVSGSDMLTGLPNRRRFFHCLKDRLSGKSSASSNFALAIADLDGFKPINDTYGHAVGDKLLTEVSYRLRTACGENCILARLGGDEFAIIVDLPKGEPELRELGRRIRHAVAQPYHIVGISMSVSISVGLALNRNIALTEGELIERADYALYRAKETNRGVVVYTSQHDTDRRNENAVGHALKNADFDSEMHIMFQPQVAMDTGRTQGFEALARWNNPQLGMVPPDVFIRTAERTGLIEFLTPLLLRKALEAAVTWPADFQLSFNLSIRDIVSPTTVDTICDVVKHSGFSAERLEFEVTETLIMTDFEQAQRSLAALRELGASIALDDFGVGYTNFEYIDKLSVGTIKIDRSFVSRMQEGAGAGKVIEAMIGLCSTLGIKNVVEGVETEHQLGALRQAGADCVQGYFFSKPLPADAVAPYLLREQYAAAGDEPLQASATG